jgi:DNA-directed RNA polymerase subunit RPC12/RpoP
MTTTTVRCPRCGRGQPYKSPQALYWCDHCRGMFDDDPDEGGTHSDLNPAARLEREERRQQNQQHRKRR